MKHFISVPNTHDAFIAFHTPSSTLSLFQVHPKRRRSSPSAHRGASGTADRSPPTDQLGGGANDGATLPSATPNTLFGSRTSYGGGVGGGGHHQYGAGRRSPSPSVTVGGAGALPWHRAASRGTISEADEATLARCPTAASTVNNNLSFTQVPDGSMLFPQSPPLSAQQHGPLGNNGYQTMPPLGPSMGSGAAHHARSASDIAFGTTAAQRSARLHHAASSVSVALPSGPRERGSSMGGHQPSPDDSNSQQPQALEGGNRNGTNNSSNSGSVPLTYLLHGQCLFAHLFQPSVHAMCFSPSVPLLDSDPMSILVAVGMSNGHVAIVRPTPTGGYVVAQAAPCRSSLPSQAQTTKRHHSVAPDGSVLDSSIPAATTQQQELLPSDEPCTTITWVRGQPLIGAGYQDGRIHWFSVAMQGPPPVSMWSALYHPGPKASSTGSVHAVPLVLHQLRLAVTQVAAYPTFQTNSFPPVLTSEFVNSSVISSPSLVDDCLPDEDAATFAAATLNSAAGRANDADETTPNSRAKRMHEGAMVVFGTATDTLLFDCSCEFVYPTSTPLTSSNGTRGSTPPIFSVTGDFLQWLMPPPGAVVPRPSRAQLIKPSAMISRPTMFLSCHYFLPIFATFSKSPTLPSAQLSVQWQSSTTIARVPFQPPGYSGVGTVDGDAPIATPGAASVDLSGGGSVLHMQLYELRNGMALPIGPARLVRQTASTTVPALSSASGGAMVMDAAWRYSTELVLVVCCSDDTSLRLFRFTGGSLATAAETAVIAPPPVLKSKLWGGAKPPLGAATHPLVVLPPNPLHLATSTTPIRWQERLLHVSSYSPIVNVEWMSAASAFLDPNSADATFQRLGQAAAAGMGEASHVLGFTNRGELTIVTTHADPVASWLSDGCVMVGCGTSLCALPLTSASSASPPALHNPPPCGDGGALCDMVLLERCRAAIETLVPSCATTAAAAAASTAAALPVSARKRCLLRQEMMGTSVEEIMALRAQGGFDVMYLRHHVRIAANIAFPPPPALAQHLSAPIAPLPVLPSEHRDDVYHVPDDTSAVGLPMLFRYIATMDAFGVSQPFGPVPGLLQWLSMPDLSVPTVSQLQDRGMRLPSRDFRTGPSGLLADCSKAMCPSSLAPSGADDPRRLLLLYMLQWIPSNYCDPQSSQLSAWLPTTYEAERLIAQWLFLNRPDEAAIVAKAHAALSRPFAALGGFLDVCSSLPPLSSFASADVSDLTVVDPTMASWIKGTGSPFGPMLRLAIEDFIDNLRNPHSQHMHVVNADQQQYLWGGTDSADLSRLTLPDRLALALLRVPNATNLDRVLRQLFGLSACTSSTTTTASYYSQQDLSVHLLLEGITERTLFMAQRYVDQTCDVQLATCLFARIAVGAVHAAEMLTAPSTLVAPSGSKSRPALQAAAALWSRWYAAYRLFLNERDYVISRARLDVQIRFLEQQAEVYSGRHLLPAGSPVVLSQRLPFPSAAGPPDAAGAAVGKSDLGVVSPLMRACPQESILQSLLPAGGSPSAGLSTSKAPPLAIHSCSCVQWMEVPGHQATVTSLHHLTIGVPMRIQLMRVCSVCHETADGRNWSCGTEGHDDSGEAENPFHNSVFVWCASCGHGGHRAHLEEWFTMSNTCASDGCLCPCTEL